MSMTWSSRTAAAARASRAKRWRAVPETASGGGQHFEGDDTQELGVAGAQDHARAPAADDFEDLIMIQPAQRARHGRWGEE